ncbi:YncE family protein [Prauserella oleivorans]|uniref:YncE family protein n=1 Tax=Prauserella oleivorans TaxID=1478153 RepID=A0ABW5WCW9_9PSEU
MRARDRVRAARRVGLVCLAGVLVLTGCSDTGGGGDALQVVENPTAAVAAPSPAATVRPAGEIVPQSGEITATATMGRTLAVAVADPASVLLYDLDDLRARPTTVPLPGAVEELTPAGDAVVASLPGARTLARIAVPSGEVRTTKVQGKPAGTAVQGGRTLVAVRDRKAVDVLDGDTVSKTITGELYSADDVLVAGGATVVLDKLRTAVFSVDVEEGTIREGLRAGEGATNAVTDSYGRVLVTDTRGDGLLAFSTDPLLLRQRYPVPGGIYGIAYDARRGIAWVTLTGRNQVVGYDVRGGEPTEKFRLPTVRQPNSVTVDQRTSRVIIGSAAGEGIQVITR